MTAIFANNTEVIASPAALASLSQLPLLQHPYKPKWLERNAHIAIAKLIRRKPNLAHVSHAYSEQTTLTTNDNGHIGLWWHGMHSSNTTPIIVVLHTIMGSPESLHKMVTELHQLTGYKVVLCLRRGHGPLALQNSRFSLFGDLDDLTLQLNTIRQRFPHAPLFGVGTSAGSALMVNHLGKAGAASPFGAAVAYCSGFDTDTGIGNMAQPYSYAMAKQLYQHFITTNSHQLVKHRALCQHLAKAKSVKAFQHIAYPLSGHATWQQYVQATNPTLSMAHIRKPLLILNARNDPICPIGNSTPYLAAIRNHPTAMALVSTQWGSHCAHFAGQGGFDWSHQVMAQYFLAQAAH